MKTFRHLATVTCAVTLFSGSALAGVETYLKYRGGNFSFENFSFDKECFVRTNGMREQDYLVPELAKLFAKAGIKVTNQEKDAPCTIWIAKHYVTVYNKDLDGVEPVSAEFLLANKDKARELNPAIKRESAEEPTENAGRMTGTFGSNEAAVLSQAGGALNGIKGAVGLPLVGVLFDLASMHYSRKTTPEGLANLNVNIRFRTGGFFGTDLFLDVYAASDTPENPATLIEAAVNRVVAELRKKVEEDKQEAQRKASQPQPVTENAQDNLLYR
jgi:hypothetical protein